jgi:small subunit ribosomal protein S6
MGKVIMKIYESLSILRPVQAETENERVVEKMKEVLTQAGATILKLDNSGKKKLAYDIQHERKGTYITVLFEGPPTVVFELERFQRMEDQVMKFMTVRLNPSDLVAAGEASREDAGDGGIQ